MQGSTGTTVSTRPELALIADDLPEALAQGSDVLAVTTASRALAALPPIRLLKKVDSRLKRNIEAALDALDYSRTLLAPAIQKLGRVVRDGQVTGFGVDAPIDLRTALEAAPFPGASDDQRSLCRACHLFQR